MSKPEKNSVSVHKSQISPPKPGSKLAMQESVRLMQETDRIQRSSLLDPNKSIKELYHEMLDNDPKYH